MAKTVLDTHILAERGVNVFADYCNRHIPYILWREEAKNDFGVDGEVELCEINDKKQIEPTGFIIKVQIKSTKGGYIESEDSESFIFRASENDVKYWESHNVDVILVIFYVDNSGNENLYARKVTNLDLANSKKSIPIKFGKKENKLLLGEANFRSKFASNFKPRYRPEIEEELISNIFKFDKLPRSIYAYECGVDHMQIFENLHRNDYPPFVIFGKRIYTFANLSDYSTLVDFAITDTSPIIHEDFLPFIQNANNRITGIRLLNNYLKDYFYKLGIRYNKQYDRYHFFLSQNLLQVNSEDIKRKKKPSWSTSWFLPTPPRTFKKRVLNKSVISMYDNYGSLPTFYRHIAFSLEYHLLEENLLLYISPKYLFTSDGKEPLNDPELITKLTTGLIKNQFNIQLIDQIYFIWSYLRDRKYCIKVSDNEDVKIFIGEYFSQKVNFGIHLDQSRSLNEHYEDEELFE